MSHKEIEHLYFTVEQDRKYLAKYPDGRFREQDQDRITECLREIRKLRTKINE